tara:strand:- start:3556 stop:3786 length:231 start_codon:yes stop_codon:yes gene_type:complete
MTWVIDMYGTTYNSKQLLYPLPTPLISLDLTYFPPLAPLRGAEKKKKNKERNRAIKLKHRGLFEGLWVYILLYVVP